MMAFLFGPLPNSIYQKVIGRAPSLFQGNNIIGTTPAAYGTSLTGPITLFSGGTLPIVLSSFNAVLNNNATNINWSIAQESNLSRFVVMRSGDGSTWAQIGTVQAKGNSSSTISYSFVDQFPLQGMNYYRLESIDIDGNFKLSEIKMIQGMFIKGIKIWPNPATDHLQITFGSNISTNINARIINQYGQVMQQKQFTNVAGTTSIMQINGYPKGIYVLHLKAADGTESAYKIFVGQ